MRVLVTGGAGFIGSNFVRHLLRSRPSVEISNFDKLTYAGNATSLADIEGNPRYSFIRGDIASESQVKPLFQQALDAVINFAAETHVDRSIEDASPFVITNVLGTQTLLQAARESGISRFVHISTDEVYGSAPAGVRFTELTPLNPQSPYAASKAAADHFVTAYANTYGVPAIILRCTNNYGPYQFPEKLIPLTISNAREDKPLPVYGDGMHERDWLYVEDYCRAIELVLDHAKAGTIYNVSSGTSQPNVKTVRTILAHLKKPDSLITNVEDRPGHDRRYALDSSKIRQELGWEPQVSFDEGIARTIAWYTANAVWVEKARSGEYAAYYERHYSNRAKIQKQ